MTDVPVQLVFHDVQVTDETQSVCWQAARHLAAMTRRVAACRIDIASRRRDADAGIEVRVDLMVRGDSVPLYDSLVGRGPTAAQLVEAIHVAFEATRLAIGLSDHIT
ncbi:MAG: hypothetical protein KDA25_12825 [Phycisphaerales bacterium]|nr:hypothetical protein [Phycisphaerales bacterium]MCA9296026.1 hypothetical protein [Phycisphaerales bacterium]